MANPFPRVKELAEGRSASFDQNFDREYTRTFQVVTNDPFIDGLAVRFAPGLPNLFDSYQIPQTKVFDSQALCVAIDPTQPDSTVPTLWHVECRYSTKSEDLNQVTGGGVVGTAPGAGGQGEDPLQLPPKAEWTFVHGTTAFTKTAVDDDHPKRKPVQNSAGQLFTPVPEIDDPYLTLRVRRAMPSYDRAQALQYMNTINSDLFQGFEPRTARIVEFSGELDFHKNRRFFWVSQAFLFKFPDWDMELLDEGDYELELAGETILRFLDGAGNPIKKKLNGEGRELAFGAEPHYLLFNPYRAKPFADLGIPPL